MPASSLATTEAPLLWFGAGIVAGLGLAAAGLLLRSRLGGGAKRDGGATDSFRQFCDQLPAQALMLDCSGVRRIFDRLIEKGVVEFGIHLRDHPELERELLGSLRIVAANKMALEACRCAHIGELGEKIFRRRASPFREILQSQLLTLWGGLRTMEEELLFQDEGGRERACLARSQIAEKDGLPDFSRVELMVIDVTAAKWTTTSRAGDVDLLRQILARANILLWWAKVWQENGKYAWKLSVPPQSFESPLYKLATAIDLGGLWDQEHAPDLERSSALAREALERNLPGYQQEFRVIGPDKTHWLSEEVGILRLSDNEWNLSGVVIDVSSRHEAEEARQASEAQLQPLLLRADCMIWQANVSQLQDGKLAWDVFSPRSVLRTKIFGEGKAGSSTILWESVDVPEFAEMNRRSSEALLKGLPGYEQEFHVRLEGGTSIWLHENVSITKEGPGLWTLVGTLTDISARREAERELAAEKEKLSVTLRAMGEGVITTDNAEKIRFWNPAAAALLRIDSEDDVGRPLAGLFSLQMGTGAASEPLPLPTSEVLIEGTLVELPIHVVLKSRDGVMHRVEGCCAPVRDAEGRIIGTVLVLRDITDRYHLEEELQRASRMESVGVLAGGIAHDFNNILTAILGNLSLMQLDLDNPQTVKSSLDEAQKAVIRAGDLTQQLLTFAKGGDPVREAVQLREVVTEVANFVLHGSKVKCDIEIPEDLWPANADKGQVGQVVQNLVLNASQAMPGGGTLRITGGNRVIKPGGALPLAIGNYVFISVEDSGVGIEPEDMARIFDPFYTTKNQGSGLGLATSYSIVKKHKGHIEVESEPGRRTAFTVWLPAMPGTAPRPTKARSLRNEKLSGRVLFMDDEEAIRNLATKLLKRSGLEVVEVIDGGEVVTAYSEALAEGRRFDVVVMDLTVPGGMGGEEALEVLLRLDPKVKAIVCSGYSSNPVLANYRAHGFKGMVSKPYEVTELITVVQKVLQEEDATP